VVQGDDARAWVRAEPNGVSICLVEEGGLKAGGTERRYFVPASDLPKGFTIGLPFRRRAWARVLAVLAALAPAGWNYDGNIVRVNLGDAAGTVIELGRREDSIVTKGQARAIGEWTSTMSTWSMRWACHEVAFQVFWGAVGERTLSRRRLRRLVRDMQASQDPAADPPNDLASVMGIKFGRL
jgi:hypothetical protein